MFWKQSFLIRLKLFIYLLITLSRIYCQYFVSRGSIDFFILNFIFYLIKLQSFIIWHLVCFLDFCFFGTRLFKGLRNISPMVSVNGISTIKIYFRPFFVCLFLGALKTEKLNLRTHCFYLQDKNEIGLL